MNGKNPFDLIEDLREKILEEIQTFTVFHWIRLGITFGLLFWVRFVIGAIIMGRAIEKVFVVYQMGVLEQENNYTFSNIIYNFYGDTFIYEAVLIIIVIYGLWLVLFWKFGLPRKVIGRS